MGSFKIRNEWKNILFRITILFILFSFTTNQIISISSVTSLSVQFTLSYYEYANIETEMISPEYDIYWTTSLPTNKIRCLCCGAIVRCIICLKPVKGASELSGCPKCDAAGHKDHMRDWVELHHRCPLCYSALTTIELIQIKNEK